MFCEKKEESSDSSVQLPFSAAAYGNTPHGVAFCTSLGGWSLVIATALSAGPRHAVDRPSLKT